MRTIQTLDERRLARLIEVGRGLTAELDLDSVLERVLETAAELTGARYAALGILDEQRRQLDNFLTLGIDEATHQEIGDLPHGRGVLGVLIADPRPLRLDDVGEHPRSYGFPPGHPPMRSFLGVPVIVRGQAWGNLYLTEKADGGAFTPEDEEATVVLADWAAIAIQNARLYREATARRDDLERAVRALEATAAIARAVGAETDVDRVLELVVKRARALVDARAVVVLLRDGQDLVVAAGAGELEPADHAAVVAAGDGAPAALARRRPSRLTDARDLFVDPAALGVAGARTALLAPLAHRGTPIGLLVAFDRLGDDHEFGAEDELLVEPFAVQAATAVAGARSAEAERLRRSLQATEAERRRWARELHDETLQALGGLKILLSSASRLEDPGAMRAAMRQAGEQLTGDIANLRAVIADLRPAALDELGLVPAIASLAQRTAARAGLQIETDLDVPGERVSPELATTVYRLVQEALTNVVRHAGASRADLEVRTQGEILEVRVADDGVGYDAATARDGGYGLVGMRERAELAGGELEVSAATAARGGTVVCARLPLS